jgi:sRNA-binding regulator protein Hfq
MIYNYNEFLNEFLNNDFKLDILCSNGISFARKIRYCDEHLVKIKSGSGRTVYKFDNDKVIKVAKNTKGIAQNEIENDFVNFDYDIVTKIYTYDYISETKDNMYIVIAEYADKVTKNKFNELESELYNRAFGQNPFAKEPLEKVADITGQNPLDVINSFVKKSEVPETFVVAEPNPIQGK